MSDSFGRRFAFLLSTLLFLVSNCVIAIIPANVGALFVFRTISAFGGCAVSAVSSGTVVDLYPLTQRARPMTYVLTGMHVATAFGPIVGGALSSPKSWRYIFWFLTTCSAVFFVVALLFLPETLRCRVGNGSRSSDSKTRSPRKWQLQAGMLQKRTVHDDERYPRPGKMSIAAVIESFRNPFVIIIWLTSGLTFAAFIAVNITSPRLLMENYDFGHTQAGLALLASGCSVIIGQFVANHVSDYLRRRCQQHHAFATTKWEIEAQRRQSSIVEDVDPKTPKTVTVQGITVCGDKDCTIGAPITVQGSLGPLPLKPQVAFEYRLTGMLMGIGLEVVGLIIYACLTHFHRSAASIITSSALIGFGTAFTMAVPQSYIVDVSPGRAATVTALLGLFRWGFAGTIAVIIKPMSHKIGVGGSFFLLAAVNVLGAAVLAYVLWMNLDYNKEDILFYVFKGGRGPTGEERQTKTRMQRFMDGAKELYHG